MSEYTLHIDELTDEISEQLDEGWEAWASIVEEINIETDTEIKHIACTKKDYTSKKDYSLEERVEIAEKYRRTLEERVEIAEKYQQLYLDKLGCIDKQYNQSSKLLKQVQTMLRSVHKREQAVTEKEQAFEQYSLKNPQEHDVVRLRTRNADMGKQILTLQKRVRELEALNT
jgi:hypothetical protein